MGAAIGTVTSLKFLHVFAITFIFGDTKYLMNFFSEGTSLIGRGLLKTFVREFLSYLVKRLIIQWFRCLPLIHFTMSEGVNSFCLKKTKLPIIGST